MQTEHPLPAGPATLQARSSGVRCMGIDLGGTKIEIAVLGADGAVLLRERTATPSGDYDAIVQAIAGLVSHAEAALGLAAAGQARLPLGMGIPGCVSPRTGLVRGANSTVLNGRALRDDLARVLGRKVHIENDANCLAVSEAVDGAAAGAGVVFAAILGTGVGAGIAIHGRALTGHNAIGGEWGHNPLPWPAAAEHPGPRCWCGQPGCIETWVSGTGFQADHLRVTGQALDAPAIVRAMRAGDPAARDSFARYCDRLARALAHVVNVLDPDVIVLGGGMSNVDEIYSEVPRLWTRHIFVHGDAVTTALRRAAHGDSSGVRGAAWLTLGAAGEHARRSPGRPGSPDDERQGQADYDYP